MKTKSKQKAFDIVWDHFIVKKSPPGMAPNGSHCEYKTKDGCMCAVGVLLTDPELKEIEQAGHMRTSILTLEEEGLLRGPLSKPFTVFLADLQHHHDTTSSSADFHSCLKERLVKLADEYKLRVPKPVSA